MQGACSVPRADRGRVCGTGHGAPEAGLCTRWWMARTGAAGAGPARHARRGARSGARGAPVHPRLVREPVAAKHGAGHRPGPGRSHLAGDLRRPGALQRRRLCSAGAQRGARHAQHGHHRTGAGPRRQPVDRHAQRRPVPSQRRSCRSGHSAGPAGERVRPDAGSRRRPVAGHECRHRPPPPRQRRHRTHRGRAAGTLSRPGQRSGRRQRVDRRRRHGRGALARGQGRGVRHGARPAQQRGLQPGDRQRGRAVGRHPGGPGALRRRRLPARPAHRRPGRRAHLRPARRP